MKAGRPFLPPAGRSRQDPSALSALFERNYAHASRAETAGARTIAFVLARDRRWAVVRRRGHHRNR